jgi:hypothetical protein
MPVIRFRERREQGAVAIVVALSISTFMLGFAALAVDMGMAYARKADLQSIADRLAVAGATNLPTILGGNGALDLVTRTLDGVCAESEVPSICPGGGAAPSMIWATNGIPADGEISFFTDPDRDGQFTLADVVGSLATPAEAIQVRLPPSHVEFGLAGALGFAGVDVTKSATARVGSALGEGVVPIPLTEADVATGQFCVVADKTLAAPIPQYRRYPAELYAYPWVQADATVVGGGSIVEEGTTVSVQLSGRFANRYRNVLIYIGNQNNAVVTSTGDSTGPYQFDLPPGKDGDAPLIWAEGLIRTGRRTWTPFVSSPTSVTYTGIPDPNPDMCDKPQSLDRGFDQVARSDGAVNELTANIRTGPDVDLYPFGLVGGLLGSLGDLCVVNTWAASSDCLKTINNQTFTTELRNGLLTGSGPDPGRLIGPCAAASDGSATDSNGVDRTRLLRDGSPLVDTSVPGGGSATALASRIMSNGAPISGWVRSEALRCPRLAVMPVVDPTLTLPVAGMLGGTPIERFVYVWIDSLDTDRGLQFSGGQLRAMRGYIIDPRYLPATTAGSKVVGPFLGTDMPKEALLIHNLGDPGT